MGVGEVVELGPGASPNSKKATASLPTARSARNTSGPKPRAACLQTYLGKPRSVSTQRILPLGAVRDGHVRIGDAVAISGLGAIGLIAVQFCCLAGAHPIIALDPLANRREAARACGADLVLDPTQCDAGLEVKKATANRGADVIIDYSGHPAAMQQALRGVRLPRHNRGRCVSRSVDDGDRLRSRSPHEPAAHRVLARPTASQTPTTPIGTTTRIYDVCWRMLAEGQVDCLPIVQPIVSFDDLLDAYPKIATQPEANIKLGVQF